MRASCRGSVPQHWSFTRPRTVCTTSRTGTAIAKAARTYGTPMVHRGASQEGPRQRPMDERSRMSPRRTSQERRPPASRASPTSTLRVRHRAARGARRRRRRLAAAARARCRAGCRPDPWPAARNPHPDQGQHRGGRPAGHGRLAGARSAAPCARTLLSSHACERPGP